MEEFMKGIGQLDQLKKLLEAVNDDDDNEGQKGKQDERSVVNKKISSTVHLLYATSKLKIYKISDKIASCAVSKDDKVFVERSEVSIPVAESWDFRLGDKVRIKYSVRDFKSIQSRTLGWNARLRAIHSCLGIVTKRDSIYENAVSIYTPTKFAQSSIYAGLLEKVSPDEDDDPVPSQWHVGDYVTTKMDLKVVELMQRRLDTIPRKYLGRKGRVIAITRASVVVTFNEKTSFDINSYLLMRCPDQFPIERKIVEHARGFKLGDKVRMISNFRKLVNNQKGKGGWAENMSIMAGKLVTIVDIHKDGTLNVQYKLGRSYKVSPDSVIGLDEVQPDGREGDIQFIRRDIVKVKMVENIRLLLEAKNVPLVFLEYLRNTAEVKLVDDDFDYLIRYNCDQNVSAYAPTVRRATPDEIERHSQIKAMVKAMEVGSQVYLDVGPPNFVKEMLKEVNASREVIYALTTPATVIGFAEDNRAIIAYKDGSRYKIQKKFLTVPEKFNVYDTVEGIEFDTAKRIQEIVATCAQIVNDDAQRPSSVKILSMTYGTPSTIDFRIFSSSATAQKLCEMLIQLCEWEVEVIPGTAVFYVRKMDSSPHEVKVSLFFNDDDYVPCSMPNGPVADSKADNASGNVKEDVAAAAAAGPMQPPGERPGGTILEHRDQLQPVVESIAEFRYLRLFDLSLARNVFFPYVVQGQRRTPVADHHQADEHDNRGRGQNVTNIYNIEKVENLKSSFY